MNNKLTEVFRRLFGITEIQPDMSPANVPGWDSFSHIELIIQLETEFGLVIPTAEAVRLTSVDQIQRYVASHAPVGAPLAQADQI